MANNKITLKLDGIVPLDLYTKAVGHFASLVANLTEEIVGDDGVRWTVTDLDSGSAFIGVTGDKPKEAERVAAGYAVVGKALQSGDVIPYSWMVVEDAIGITSVLNGKITGARFGDAVAEKAVISRPVVYEEQAKQEVRDFGVIEGIVRTISDTKGLVLSLYDDVFERRIVVYLGTSILREEQARAIWRKRVRITGMVRRNPDTGSAVDIRGVTNIEMADPRTEGSLLRARGILPWESGDESPEVMIRRLRDGE